MQVDLLAGSLREVGEELQGSLAQGDVELVGEVRAYAASGTRRRAAGEFVTLQQHDLDTGLREVKGGGRAHDATAHDDDVSAVRQGRLCRPAGLLEKAHRRKPGSYGSSSTSICAFCSLPL